MPCRFYLFDVTYTKNLKKVLIALKIIDFMIIRNKWLLRFWPNQKYKNYFARIKFFIFLKFGKSITNIGRVVSHKNCFLNYVTHNCVGNIGLIKIN